MNRNHSWWYIFLYSQIWYS